MVTAIGGAECEFPGGGALCGDDAVVIGEDFIDGYSDGEVGWGGEGGCLWVVELGGVVTFWRGRGRGPGWLVIEDKEGGWK